MSEFEHKNAYEVCPHCGEEVKLDAELKVQTCPNCGKRIVTCSMCRACDSGENYCSKCCLCFQAEAENADIELLHNDIALWLLDRVAQGEHEEVGSMDWRDYPGDGETQRVSIMKNEDGEFDVWMSDTPCADFVLTKDSTGEEIRKAVDKWFSEN